ncbi:MAG: M14 family zinc carboxypeptidase [candidate division KSB1 bacterium]|nr:M14 family zinc carboxypeptidase [candidate division KSB1 bacterium]MDZ7274890.1 M14 family zinc carboxypeptidase [candidate division KSB1 bacterium]MDZ7286658.1 M14 family zinc carboxypeptidase [candidate division KSB1 bacterium]MDZ7299179.1 M14 family zinc carboxypeptidase [candidate division KSB1 bacterium]MDZ7307011.1 M14 family zinc carboxypeptidase [candidate division KSB1 bacterium]
MPGMRKGLALFPLRRLPPSRIMLSLAFYSALLGLWLMHGGRRVAHAPAAGTTDAARAGAVLSSLPHWSWGQRFTGTQAAATSRQQHSTAPQKKQPNLVVPAGYPTLAELQARFQELVQRYPQLAHLDTIGRSSTGRHPILAIRLTAPRPGMSDKPAFLISALHHAREPLGVFICHALMNRLLSNYGSSTRHTRLLDSLEIWLVPIVNPDGYEYLMTSRREYPWWRKNLRDNNGDGSFDPLSDGVDLNRNYGYNWSEGGEDEPGSWFYRGPEPFSEPEIRALRQLALHKRFVMGISYHSYGEAILYPWGNYTPPPDQQLILDIAEKCAARIERFSGPGCYSILPLNGRAGQSSVWMYGALGTVDFIIETGEEYFPSLADADRIVEQNLPGAFYLLERALGAGICGRVVDDETGEPVPARIHVAGLEADHVQPRQANGREGWFQRLLLPGTYAIEVRVPDYEPARFFNVLVRDQHMTSLHVGLKRMNGRTSGNSH